MTPIRCKMWQTPKLRLDWFVCICFSLCGVTSHISIFHFMKNSAPQAISMTTVEKNAARVGEVYTYSLGFQRVLFLESYSENKWIQLCTIVWHEGDNQLSQAVWSQQSGNVCSVNCAACSSSDFTAVWECCRAFLSHDQHEKKVNVWNTTLEYSLYTTYYFT